MKKNNKGFTLAELLIVVAIIAVLTAIAIPVFQANLEKAKEGADAANLRAAYAMAAAAALDENGKDILIKNITLKQSGAFTKIAKDDEKVMIGDFELTSGEYPAGTYHLGYKADNGHVIIGTDADTIVTSLTSAVSQSFVQGG